MPYGKTENGKPERRQPEKRVTWVCAMGGAVIVTIILLAYWAQQPNRTEVDGGRQERDSSFSNTSSRKSDIDQQVSIVRTSGRNRGPNDDSATKEKGKSETPSALSQGSRLIVMDPDFVARYGLSDQQVQATVDYLNQVKTECQDAAASRLVRKTERDKPDQGIFHYAIEHCETPANEKKDSIEAKLGQIAGVDFAAELGKAMAARTDFLGFGIYDVEITIRLGKQRDNGDIVPNAAQMFYFIPGTRQCAGMFNTSLVGLTISTRLFELDPDVIKLDDPFNK